MTFSAENASADFIKTQLGTDYDRFDAAEQELHARLLQAVQRPGDVALDTRKADGDRSIVTVCTSDSLGALSIISGLFTAYRMDILSVDAFTVQSQESSLRSQPGRRRPQRRRRPSKSASPTRKILDIFGVRALDEVEPDTWSRFEEDLKKFVSLLSKGGTEEARDQIIDWVSEVARETGDTERQLFPMHIEVSNDTSPSYTQLDIRSTDAPGFLFAFTNALAMVHVNIERAEVRTLDDGVHDTFWLTGANRRKIVREDRLHNLRVATALINQFTHLLPRSPNPAQALRQFSALTHQMLSHPDWARELSQLESMDALETLAGMMGVSQFLWEDFLRMQHENLFPVILNTPALDERRPTERLRDACRRQLRGANEHHERVVELNRFKDREMFRIDLRHITGRVGFREFSEELSDLAEVVIEGAAELAYSEVEERSGVPMLGDGRRCSWCVCALGKFGGRELGFGSDVELVFVYEGEGTTRGGGPIENSWYFGDFVRAFLNTLTTRREGIFEIDLRLRPFGNKGPLASSIEAFRDYYSERGAARQFERMALVKLRPVAGDPELGRRVVQSRDEFVYSGAPLDVEDIIHLRSRQSSELVPRGTINAKHSPGGLVDLEYYVQALQIEAGHTDESVRVSNTLDAIEKLCQSRHISPEQARELGETYGFLRRLIDSLRVVRGHARELTIPAADSREFEYLAQRLQFESAEHLQEAIAGYMDRARQVWDRGVSTG